MQGDVLIVGFISTRRGGLGMGFWGIRKAAYSVSGRIDKRTGLLDEGTDC
jgi:hypothetical protein